MDTARAHLSQGLSDYIDPGDYFTAISMYG